MNSYDAVFIINSTLNKDETEKAISYIKDQILKQKGDVEKLEDLGKKKLPYRIKKQREGQYYVLNFKVEPNIIKELRQAYKLNDSILKVFITRKEK